MKFRVTFLDGVDLLIEAEKEVDAVRKARELKDRLSVVNTDYFSGEDLSKYSESFLRERLEELEKVQPIPKNLSSEWNAVFSELEKRGIVKRVDKDVSDAKYSREIAEFKDKVKQVKSCLDWYGYSKHGGKEDSMNSLSKLLTGSYYKYDMDSFSVMGDSKIGNCNLHYEFRLVGRRIKGNMDLRDPEGELLEFAYNLQ